MNKNNTYDFHRRNIRKVYTFCFFWMFLVFIPVMIPYFSKLGFSMKQIFELQAIFGISIAVFEVPSGYISDIIGRKKSLVIGSFLAAIGFTSLLYIQSFYEFVFYEILLAMAASLISGADLSLLYDSLDKITKERKEKTKAVANIQMAYVCAEAIAAVFASLLIIYSYQHVMVAQAIASWIAFTTALLIYEPPYKKMDTSAHKENFKKILSHIFCSEKLLRLIFLNLFLWSLCTFVVVWIFQKYWEVSGIEIRYFGYIWALYNLAIGIVGKQVHWLEHKFGATPLLLGLSILPLIGFFGMSYSTGIIGVVIGLSFQVSRGITQVILRDALNWRIPSEFRATANSLSSLFMRGSFGLIGPLIGYTIDKKGIPITLQYLGGVFFIICVFVMFPLIREVRKNNQREIPH